MIDENTQLRIGLTLGDLFERWPALRAFREAYGLSALDALVEYLLALQEAYDDLRIMQEEANQ